MALKKIVAVATNRGNTVFTLKTDRFMICYWDFVAMPFVLVSVRFCGAKLRFREY